jgi:hypothetical protein
MVADGMARPSTRQEPVRDGGNGREMEARQGAIRIFFKRDAVRWIVKDAYWSKRYGPPDARS